MNTKDIIGFQFGRADAIRTVASSSSAIWTGIVLVLLTAFARNYDQTYIPEKWLLWFLGPLLFSLVSGTWLFCISYAVCARFRMAEVAGKKPAPSSAGWRGFMGAFWMTAPVAWLYAIPVERFLDSLDAAKANLTLLGVVSLWRVLLMARVLQVICGAPFLRALLWVLLPASLEVLAVTFFGGGLEKRILASMSGMRNSPEEELMFRAIGNIFSVAFYCVPTVILILLVWRWRGTALEWPAAQRNPINWRLLLAAALFWIVVTIPMQRELRHNFIVERFIKDGKLREAITYMNQHQPDDFAKARVLPPKLYELTTLQEVPAFVAALQPSDAKWVQEHGVRAATVMVAHFAGRSQASKPSSDVTPDEFLEGLRFLDPDPAHLATMLKSLSTFHSGRDWLKVHASFLEALALMTQSHGTYAGHKVATEDNRVDWNKLSSELHRLGHTNAATNLLLIPSP
jgi:hypothetical protein